MLFVVVLLAVGAIADAQQAAKVARIGFLATPPIPPSRTGTTHSSMVCATLDIGREKTLTLSVDQPMER